MPFLGWEAVATHTDRVLWVLLLPSCLPRCVGTRAQGCQQAPEQPLMAFDTRMVTLVSKSLGCHASDLGSPSSSVPCPLFFLPVAVKPGYVFVFVFFFFFLNFSFFSPLSQKVFSLLSSSVLPSCFCPRLRSGDGDVPPSAQLHPQPRGRLLLGLRRGPRDRTRVSRGGRAGWGGAPLFAEGALCCCCCRCPKSLGIFPPGWAWSTTGRATAALTRPAWGASWRRWCRPPSTATTGPAAAARSSGDTSSKAPCCRQSLVLLFTDPLSLEISVRKAL